MYDPDADPSSIEWQCQFKTYNLSLAEVVGLDVTSQGYDASLTTIFVSDEEGKAPSYYVKVSCSQEQLARTLVRCVAELGELEDGLRALGVID